MSNGYITPRKSDYTDCNSITSSGEYNFYSNTANHAPYDEWFFLKVFRHMSSSTLYVRQIALGMKAQDMFTRCCNNGTWSAWERVH